MTTLLIDGEPVEMPDEAAKEVLRLRRATWGGFPDRDAADAVKLVEHAMHFVALPDIFSDRSCELASRELERVYRETLPDQPEAAEMLRRMVVYLELQFPSES